MEFKELIEKIEMYYGRVYEFAMEERPELEDDDLSEEDRLAVKKLEKTKDDLEDKYYLEEKKSKNDYPNLPYNERMELESLKPLREAMDKAKNDYYRYWDNIYDKKREKSGIPEWKEVEQYGGTDMGSTWYSVKYFPSLDMYIRVDGYYSSYNGTDFYESWDCCKEVRPITKEVIFYE